MWSAAYLVLSDVPWEDPGVDDFGDPGFDNVVPTGVSVAFGLFFALVVVVGVVSAIWRVSTARRMARDAGLDERDATTMALLSDEGLSTTYLASSLRQQSAPSGQPGATRPVAERLRELSALREEGLLTEEEYAERRRAILDEV